MSPLAVQILRLLRAQFEHAGGEVGARANPVIEARVGAYAKQLALAEEKVVAGFDELASARAVIKQAQNVYTLTPVGVQKSERLPAD